MQPEELRRLRQDANEMQRQEVRLVYDFLEPQQLSFGIVWPVNDPAHLLDHGAGQIAGRSQLQSTCLGCSSKQKQRIGWDRRSRDFCRSQVGFEADRMVIGRGFVVKCIETVEVEYRPGRFDAIEPSANLGIF